MTNYSSNSSRSKFTLLLTLFVSLIDVAFSLELVVANWSIPVPKAASLPPRTAVVGDTVTFIWSTYYRHNVYLHPSGDCSMDGSIEMTPESYAKYTFTAADADKGKLVFASQTGSDCVDGLILTFTVVKQRLQGEVIPIDNWSIPSGVTYLPPMDVVVGDIVEFRWNSNYGGYDVWKHAAQNCEFEGSIAVGSRPRAQYTFTEDDLGEVYFACQYNQGEYCKEGMLMTITVYATRADIPIETPPPTPSPSRATKSTPSPSKATRTTPSPSASKSVPTLETANSNFDVAGPEDEQQPEDGVPTRSPIVVATGSPVMQLSPDALQKALEKDVNNGTIIAIVCVTFVSLIAVGLSGFFALRSFGVIGHTNDASSVL